MFDIRKIQEHVIYEAVKGESNEDIAKEVVYGKEESGKSEDNGIWVNSTMNRLEGKFDKATTKKIRMNCQCGYGMDEKLQFMKELMELSSSLEELGNSQKAKDAGLFYENGELYLQFNFCPCPMLAEVDRLDSGAWCQCTTGYSKVLFEKSFQCKVEVELLESIKMGDKRCLMKIMPKVPKGTFRLAQKE